MNQLKQCEGHPIPCNKEVWKGHAFCPQCTQRLMKDVKQLTENVEK